MAQEQIDEAMADVYEQDFGFNVSTIFKNLTIYLAFSAVFALIFAAIFKKEKPMFDTDNQ